MYRKTTLSISLILLVGIFFLSACTSKANTEPTPDPDAIRTQAVQTVQSQLTQTALAKPSATPTNTLVPTNTAAPATATLSVTLTPVATILVPTATLDPGIPADKMTFVSQDPIDGTQFAPGQTFTVRWTVKNTGPTTWNTNYQVRFYAGNRMGAVDTKISKEVKPQESIDLVVTMTAPRNAGEYNSTWVLTNADGLNFGGFYVTIKVGAATATALVPTATIAPTETTAPAATATTTPTP